MSAAVRISITYFLVTCALGALLLSAGCGSSSGNRIQGYVEGEFVYVAAPYAGALEKLSVQKGSNVKAGTPLYTLERESEKDARDQAKAALTLSEKEFARQEKLLRIPGSTSQQEFDRARSTLDQDRKRVARAEWDLSQKQQYAPKSGLVFDTLYREGEWVAAGRPVVVLLPPDNIKVRAFVPETLIGKVRLGDSANVFIDGVKSGHIAGKVSFISQKAEFTPPVIYSRESREKLVFMIEVVFNPDTAATLHPGQPVELQFGS